MTDPTPAPALTLQEVAEDLDVHYMTVYRYVRLGMLPARRSGRSWLVDRTDLEAFRSDAATPTERGTAPWDERLLNRMLAPDDAGAWSVVEAALASGVTPAAVHTDMLSPALRAVGAMWQDGEIDVAQEHAASDVATRVIARLAPMMSHRGVRRGTIVVGSTQTELHSIPLAIVSELFRSRRFDVVDLGANLPPAAFASAVARADDLVAVAIGVTTPGQDDQIAATIAAIRSATDAPILLGGAGITPDEGRRFDADAVSVTGEEAIDAIESIMASR
jgi:excisionase family DNA binding protein